MSVDRSTTSIRLYPLTHSYTQTAPMPTPILQPLYCRYDYVEKLDINQVLNQVDFDDSVDIDQQTETPCFWYCGVTGIMAAIEASKIANEICITHSPGHMLITDVKDNDEVLQ